MRAIIVAGVGAGLTTSVAARSIEFDLRLATPHTHRSVSSSSAQQWPPSDSAVLAWIRARVDSKASTGIVVGFLAEGRPHIVAYGNADDRSSRPLDGNTLFEIGSITKTFTSMVLADMVVKGEVSLSDPVAKFLPSSIKVPSRAGREITLLDLATQTSGLPRLPTNFAPKDPANPYADYTVPRLYDFLSTYALPRDIGVSYEYSNVGMGLLGHALSLKAGMSYEALVKSRVLDPLGMRQTAVALTASLRARFATGHNEAGQTVGPWDFPVLAGAGALRSTPNDMLTYLAAVLDTTSGPLARASALAQRPVRQISPDMSIGLAWHVIQPGDNAIVWHNGGTGGFHSFIGVRHANGANVVVLSNTSSDIDDIGLHVIDANIPLKTLPAERRAITLSPAVLEPFVGRYELSPTFAIDITRQGNDLWAQATGQPKVQLFAESESRFFLRAFDAQVEFVKDDRGTVTGLALHQGGAISPAKKVR